ncbi:MAG: hypothetical protein K8U57_31605 [Planctomycetes bacterium]|nr:hypothetical protein [Planctomycetota bacterium]
MPKKQTTKPTETTPMAKRKPNKKLAQEASYYIHQLLAGLQKYAADPSKCVEIMLHDDRDRAGLRGLFNKWDDEEYEQSEEYKSYERDRDKQSREEWEVAHPGQSYDEHLARFRKELDERCKKLDFKKLFGK